MYTGSMFAEKELDDRICPWGIAAIPSGTSRSQGDVI